MRIYVAGGSDEVDLVAGYMKRLHEMGHEITHNWTAIVKRYGGNPADATDGQRTAWSGADIGGVSVAQVVWLLMPERPSFGAGFECGFACGRGIPYIVSGNWRKSVFSACAIARCDTHEEALHGIGLYQIGVDNVRSER